VIRIHKHYYSTMKYKILGVIWFNTIGIVAVDSNGFGWKCYIGNGIGSDEESDSQFIAENGMPTGRGVALGAFPQLNPDGMVEYIETKGIALDVFRLK
jgi:hypothetical protein